VSLLVLNVAQQAVMGVGLFACMTNAARQVMRGKMSVGDLVLVNTYLLQLYQPLNWIGSIYRMIQQNFVEMEQLFSLLEEPVDIKDAPNATDLDALSSVRRTVGVIPQDAALFQNTIEYNIAYAKPGDGAVPRTEVEEAAQGAQMHKGILAFPDGYQSQVGERGLRLSGGERQRLSLARVLLKQAPVVVLDEATSALDSRTEAQVQVALQRACAGRTSLVIAHRLSTISHADRILVLVNGSVAEAGSHQELLKRNGHYADMWKLQQLQQLADAPSNDTGSGPNASHKPSRRHSRRGSRGSVLRVRGGCAAVSEGVEWRRGGGEVSDVTRARHATDVTACARQGAARSQRADDEQGLRRQKLWWRSLLQCLTVSPKLHSSLVARAAGTVEPGPGIVAWHSGTEPRPHSLGVRLEGTRFLKAQELDLVMQIYGDGHSALLRPDARDRHRRAPESADSREMTREVTHHMTHHMPRHMSSSPSWPGGGGAEGAEGGRASAAAGRSDMTCDVNSLPSWQCWPGGVGGGMASATSFHPPHFPSRLTPAQAKARLETPDGAFLLLNFSALLSKTSSAPPLVSYAFSCDL